MMLIVSCQTPAKTLSVVRYKPETGLKRLSMQIAKSNSFLTGKINNIAIQFCSKILSFKVDFSSLNKVLSEKAYEHNTFRAYCFL